MNHQNEVSNNNLSDLTLEQAYAELKPWADENGISVDELCEDFAAFFPPDKAHLPVSVAVFYRLSKRFRLPS